MNQQATIPAALLLPFEKGGLRARLTFADVRDDVGAIAALRQRVWRETAAQIACDPFDKGASYLCIESHTGALLACLRLFVFSEGRAAQAGYCGQFYDLSGLCGRDAVILEVGRLSVMPVLPPQDAGGEAVSCVPVWEVLRMIWLAVSRVILACKARYVIGASSFEGSDVLRHQSALRHLYAHHLGPVELRPRMRARLSWALADLEGGAIAEDLEGPRSASKSAAVMAQMPPLLRFYLGLGGWVSDHAVIDPDLDTVHVFTCLDVDEMDPARRRALRAALI